MANTAGPPVLAAAPPAAAPQISMAATAGPRSAAAFEAAATATTFVGASSAAAPEAGAARSPRAARWVGASRRSNSRRHTQRRGYAQTGDAERTARRHVGSKLQVACEAVVLPVPFDASRIKTKIQVGLRASARVRAASGRESSTPVTNKDSESANVYMRGNHLVSTLRSQSRTTKTSMTDLSVGGMPSAAHSLGKGCLYEMDGNDAPTAWLGSASGLAVAIANRWLVPG